MENETCVYSPCTIQSHTCIHCSVQIKSSRTTVNIKNKTKQHTIYGSITEHEKKNEFTIHRIKIRKKLIVLAWCCCCRRRHRCHCCWYCCWRWAHHTIWFDSFRSSRARWCHFYSFSLLFSRIERWPSERATMHTHHSKIVNGIYYLIDSRSRKCVWENERQDKN